MTHVHRASALVLFLTITSVLFLAVALYSIPYLLEGTHDPQAAPHRYVPCLVWFLSAMTLVAATRHLAVLWAAVVSLAAHFVVGAAKSLFTLRSWWSSGLEMTVAGVIVGGATYVLGLLFKAAP